MVMVIFQNGVRYALDPVNDRMLFLDGVREYTSKLTPHHKKVLGNLLEQEV